MDEQEYLEEGFVTETFIELSDGKEDNEDE